MSAEEKLKEVKTEVKTAIELINQEHASANLDDRSAVQSEESSYELEWELNHRLKQNRQGG